MRIPPTRHPVPIVVVVGCALLAWPGWLGGAPTLTTPVLDGAFGDWAAVLANPENRVLDAPAGGLPEGDGVVPASRNIDTVAFTWDATYLYFYVHRQATSPEFNYFWFHFDLDNDGLVAHNAPLLRVGWWGNNRRVDTSLDRYQAAGLASGDPVAGPGGAHDGYRLPGTRLAGPLLESLNTGGVNGLEMELRVSWAALGVAPGTALQFHVSTTRRVNEYPGVINDNTGGTNAFAGVLLSPDRALTTVPGGAPLAIPHTLANTGNLTDVIDLTWTSSGAFAPVTVAFYRDVDASGTLTPADTLLTDTDGDTLPDAGALAPAGTVSLLAVADIPPAAALGQTSVLTLRGTSSARPAVADTAVDTITIAAPALTLVKSVDLAAALPGEVLTYSVTYANTGTADAHGIEVTDTVPAWTSYVSGSAAGAGMAVTFSHDGGLTWDASEALPVTHVRWSRAAPLPAGASGAVGFQVLLN